MISVVTLTFNNFDELKKTIDSLPDDVESIVINGGSCSKTIDFLSSYRGKSLSEKDKGISDAFNKGFQLSTGRYVVYLNSGDELIDTSYYSEAINILNSNSQVDFVYADICFIDQFAGEIRARSDKKLPNMPFLHPTLIVRRSVMEKIGLFSLEYNIAMDLDFAYRLVKSGGKGKYIPRMVVKMDGLGVSSHNYVLGFKEVLAIIFRNKDFSMLSIRFIIFRSISLIAKLLFLKFKGDKVLGQYRKRRYQIKP